GGAGADDLDGVGAVGGPGVGEHDPAVHDRRRVQVHVGGELAVEIDVRQAAVGPPGGDPGDLATGELEGGRRPGLAGRVHRAAEGQRGVPATPGRRVGD